MQQRSRLIPPLRYLAERLRCWWLRKGISGMASIDEDLNSVRTQLRHARNNLSSAEARLNDIERRAREEESGSWVQVKLDENPGRLYAYNVNSDRPLKVHDRVVVRLPGGHLTVRRVFASGRGKHPKATKNAAFVISDSFLHHVAEIGGV
jgi:hypothetical protein